MHSPRLPTRSACGRKHVHMGTGDTAEVRDLIRVSAIAVDIPNTTFYKEHNWERERLKMD